MCRKRWAIRIALAGTMALATDARAFCRTSTCPLPSDYSPAASGMCQPANFAALCQARATPINPVPLWWRNACVSYDVQQDASPGIPLETAQQVAAEAFAKWTATECSNGDGGLAPISIDVRDLGPVSCDKVQYNSDQGNQHVILFRNPWPYESALNTLGLTTVTFDYETGELYDADMEINSAVKLSVSDPVPSDGYDLRSIVTHEAGHFLGLAHSTDFSATMFASYEQGSTSKRTLKSDDMDGICAIYPPNGTRSADPSVHAVDSTVQPNGTVTEEACNPTPRHGFQSTCRQPSSSCAISADRRPPRRPRSWTLAAVGALAMGGLLRRSRARRGSRPG